MLTTIVIYGIIICSMIYMYVNLELEKDNAKIKSRRAFMFAK